MENVYVFIKYSTQHIPSVTVQDISLKKLRKREDTRLDQVGVGFLREVILHLSKGLTTATVLVRIYKTHVIITINYLPKIIGYVQYIGQLSIFYNDKFVEERAQVNRGMITYLQRTRNLHPDVQVNNIVTDDWAVCFIQDTDHKPRKM